jgi:hypothetical protein
MKGYLKQLAVIAVTLSAFCFAAFAQQSDRACPEIKVVGPSSSLMPGENAVMTATVGNGLSGEYKYFWTVSAGAIPRGQGTSRIEILTAGLPTTEIIASLKISGLPAQCVNTISETILVSAVPNCGLGDEFSDLSANEIKARLDNFFVEIQNDPDSEGLIQLFFHKKDSYAAKVRMVKLYFNHILFRKMDRARLTFAFIESKDDYRITRLRRIPKGAQMPIENGSTVIPAEYLKEQIPYVIR